MPYDQCAAKTIAPNWMALTRIRVGKLIVDTFSMIHLAFVQLNVIAVGLLGQFVVLAKDLITK